ncbi:glycosyl transferase family 1 [Mangrovibacter sp. MFB070]|nr:glycosyltransferase [Mangrovibacter sp. MFB070]KEA50321.1 glycosyl transferase family 1 [Mangrovibacter sp. MFB070]
MVSGQRNILLLDNGKEWGGGTNSMLELLKRIDRKKFQITCCFYYNYTRGEQENIEQVLQGIQIPVIFLPQARQPFWAGIAKEILRSFCVFSRSGRKKVTYLVDKLWRIKPNARRLRQIIQQNGFDVLYMNNQPHSNIEGYLAAEGLPVAVVQHCRIEPVLTPDVVQLVNNIASHTIAVSKGVEHVLTVNGIDASRTSTVSNAIDIHQQLPDRQSVRKTLKIGQGTFVFCSIGSLIPRKSSHHTLEALAQFHQRHPAADWLFILVGEGPERSHLEQLAQQYGIAEHVIFTGFKNNPLDYLAASDVFVLASKSEGLPRVVLESMLLETVVVGSAVTGTAELIAHNRTGLLFEYGDVNNLANHLSQVWEQVELRETLAHQARQQVEEHYTIEKYVAGVEQILANAKPYRNHNV